MAEELLDVANNSEEPLEPEVINLPVPVSTSHALRRYHGQTGDKINKNPVRYEVVRMLMENMTYPEIVENLRIHFGFKVAELTVAAFKKNFLHYHSKRIDRWDKQRHQYLVARITEEMKEASRSMVHEVYELQNLLVVVEERMDLIRNDEDMRSSSYEGVLKDLIRTKAALLERMSKITGTTGMEGRLKDVVKQTAMAVQKTLVPHLKEDRRDEAFMLFDHEIEEVLMNIESVSAMGANI